MYPLNISYSKIHRTYFAETLFKMRKMADVKNICLLWRAVLFSKCYKFLKIGYIRVVPQTFYCLDIHRSKPLIKGNSWWKVLCFWLNLTYARYFLMSHWKGFLAIRKKWSRNLAKVIWKKFQYHFHRIRVSRMKRVSAIELRDKISSKLIELRYISAEEIGSKIWNLTSPFSFSGVFRPQSNVHNKLLSQNLNPLSANPTKWSNTLKQFIGNGGQIVGVCLTILWGWRIKGKNIFYRVLNTPYESLTAKVVITLSEWKLTLPR